MLSVMRNKLSSLSMSGRDMTVTFPDGIEEAVEGMLSCMDLVPLLQIYRIYLVTRRDFPFSRMTTND